MKTTKERFLGIKKIGNQEKWTIDLYHKLLTSSWPKFFLSYVLFFLLFNLIFAFGYWYFPDSISNTNNSFWLSFAFSVQTFSTVGYGVFAPQSSSAHTIVIIQSVLSVFVTALLTGLTFSKFSRPSARILFSKNILINTFDGKRTLMLRIGNLRANQIAEAQVKMIVLKPFTSIEGERLRRQYDVNLVRNSSLFFAFTWTIIHIIDESSPFFGLSLEDFKERNIEIGISLMGYDESFSQSIQASSVYSTEDIVFDKYFEDVFVLKDSVLTAINYKKFHLLKS